MSSIPPELLKDYTLNGSIPIFDWFLNENNKDKIIWDVEKIEDHLKRFTSSNIKNNNEGYSPYGHEPCIQLLRSFEKYEIKNKNVGVLGSTSPWIEAILINLGNKVTTIEYNIPKCNHDKIKCESYFDDFEKNKTKYDCVVTFSSIEHSGLGRYGDPLDPNGDIRTMNTIHSNLISNGLLIWGAPVGQDTLVWNAHRIYGEKRLPLIFEKFKELEWFGIQKSDLNKFPLTKDSLYQPVVVLQPKH